MKEWTGIEIQRAKQGLEQAAAVALGQMLFEFARLDMALGLVLVWSDGGKQLDKLTKAVTDLSFHKRLDLLHSFVATLYPVGNGARVLYDAWLKDAHSVRLVRNELVHGRWGVDPMKDQVFNVVGLPTSPNQQTKGYAVSELKDIVAQMGLLQHRLSVLRTEWPV
ncbi:MAG: hypothetical protein Q7T62_02145 [Undibacterium sp.]|nr:hypothetical protein [Undibacterium sp.]